MTRWAMVLLVMTGCGAAQLEHPATLDLGDVALFQSRTTTLQLVNHGPGAADLELQLVGADFSLDETSRATLAEGETRQVPVRFAPTELGPRAGLLSFRSGGSETTVELRGHGVGARLSAPREVALAPLAIVHGEPQPIVSVPVVVSNVGTVGSELHLEPPGVSTEVCVGAFDGVGRCTAWVPPARLLAGERVAVPVQVRPLSAGARSWTVTLLSDDPRTRAQVVTVRAIVEEFEPCVLEGPAQLLLDAAPVSLTLTNRGAGLCLVRAAQLESSPPDAFTLASEPRFPVRLAVGGALTLRLAARVDAPRTATGTLHVVTDQGRVRDVALAFKPSALDCLVATPDPLDFGVIVDGCQSAPRTITLYDTCTTPLTLDAVSLVTAEFSIVSGVPAGTTLRPGATPAQLSVKYAPLDVGPDVATLAVEVRDGGTHLVTLMGRGDVAGTQVDRFDNAPLPVVDMLVMVDTSPSFAPRRSEVRANFVAWLANAHFECLDARWAFAPAEGAPDASVAFALNDAGSAWTSSQEPDFVARALSAFDALPDSSETEACIGPAAALMQGVATRDGGSFIGLCVTDALEQSPSPMAALSRLQARVASPSQLSWSSATGLAASSCPVEAVDDGTHAALVQASNGARADVCAQWWQSFPVGFSCGVRTRFFLTQRPSPGTVVVSVDGVPLPATAWTFDATDNAIVFNAGQVPRPGTSVAVQYLPTCAP